MSRGKILSRDTALRSRRAFSVVGSPVAAPIQPQVGPWVGVLQVRGCSLIKRKIPFLSPWCCSSSEREEKRRNMGEGKRSGDGGREEEKEREEWDLTFTCERRGRGRRESTRLPGWLARYVSGMHAHRSFLFPLVFPSRATPIVFFFFLHHFCFRLLLLSFAKVQSLLCVPQRAQAFSTPSYYDNFGEQE